MSHRSSFSNFSIQITHLKWPRHDTKMQNCLLYMISYWIIEKLISFVLHDNTECSISRFLFSPFFHLSTWQFSQQILAFLSSSIFFTFMHDEINFNFNEFFREVKKIVNNLCDLRKVWCNIQLIILFILNAKMKDSLMNFKRFKLDDKLYFENLLRWKI